MKQHTIEQLIGHQGIKKEFKSLIEINEDSTYKNLWDVAKAVSTMQFTALSAYMKKRQISQDQIMHLADRKTRTNQSPQSTGYEK